MKSAKTEIGGPRRTARAFPVTLQDSGHPEGRISRIAFATDMTRAHAPEILLGFMLEAVWPDQARWLGLVGRSQLNPIEVTRIDLNTWPELGVPFSLLDKLFEKGWAAPWGEAGRSIEIACSRSAITICTDKFRDLHSMKADTSEGWASTRTLLCEHLNSFIDELTQRRVEHTQKIPTTVSAPPLAPELSTELRTKEQLKKFPLDN